MPSFLAQVLRFELANIDWRIGHVQVTLTPFNIIHANLPRCALRCEHKHLNDPASAQPNPASAYACPTGPPLQNPAHHAG